LEQVLVSAVVPRIPVGKAEGFGLALADGFGLALGAGDATTAPSPVLASAKTNGSSFRSFSKIMFAVS